jgi:outer membrane protein assembly factor BamB
VIGSVLYTAAETNSGDYVYALNIGDRSLRWRQQLSHPVVSSVVTVNQVSLPNPLGGAITVASGSA